MLFYPVEMMIGEGNFVLAILTASVYFSLSGSIALILK